MRTFASSELLDGLQRLDLRGNPLQNEGVRRLVESEHAAGLSRLYIGATKCGDPCARAIASSPHSSGLFHLSFQAGEFQEVSEITRDGWQALCESQYLSVGITNHWRCAL